MLFRRLKKISSDQYYELYHPLILKQGVGFVADYTHKTLERIPDLFLTDLKTKTVLEVGAGNGEHLHFVKHEYEEYIETDIRLEILKDATKERIFNSKISQARLDANDLSSLPSNSVDRLIATCVLVHLEKPKFFLEEVRRICKEGAIISLYVPCEPGLFLRYLRYWTTARNARKMGVNHLHFHYQEHKYHILHIREIIRSTFSQDVVKNHSYPFNKFSWNLNLWEIYQIKIIKNSLNDHSFDE